VVEAGDSAPAESEAEETKSEESEQAAEEEAVVGTDEENE